MDVFIGSKHTNVHITKGEHHGHLWPPPTDPTNPTRQPDVSSESKLEFKRFRMFASTQPWRGPWLPPKMTGEFFMKFPYWWLEASCMGQRYENGIDQQFHTSSVKDRLNPMAWNRFCWGKLNMDVCQIWLGPPNPLVLSSSSPLTAILGGSLFQTHPTKKSWSHSMTTKVQPAFARLMC